jgi:hypothetical protein
MHQETSKTPTLMPPTRRGARFGPPSATPQPQAVVETATIGKKEREKKPKVKADPVLIAKAKELRDRYLEQFNAGMVLPSAKYEVARELPSAAERGSDLQFAIEDGECNRKSLPQAA